MRFVFSRLKRIIAGMGVILLVTVQATASAAQYPTVKAEIPVSQTFTNNSGENVNGTFTYRITADKDNPVVEGMTDDTISIEGNKEISLEIVFDRVGVYKYEVKQEFANKSGYTYDSSVYTVTVYVRNDGDDGLKTDVFIQNPDGEKLNKLEFINSYQKQEATTGEPQPPTAPGESTTEKITTESVTTEDDTEDENDTEEDTEDDKPKGNGTKTGERAIWPYYLLLICGMTLLGVCIRIKKLQK